MRRTAIAALSLIFAVAGIALGGPANAAQVGTVAVAAGPSDFTDGICNVTPSTFSVTPSGGVATGPGYTFSGSGTDVVRVTNSCSGMNLGAPGTFWIQRGVTYTPVLVGQYVDVPLSGGNFQLVTAAGGLGNRIVEYLVSTSGGGGGGGGSSSSSSAPPTRYVPPPPPTYNISLTGGADSTAACSAPAQPAVSGTWVTLPAANQCVRIGPDAKADTVLLGWSTSKTFPIATAQNQVDKGFNQWDGEVGGQREIFIPAGQQTFLSGDNTLYPIWSA